MKNKDNIGYKVIRIENYYLVSYVYTSNILIEYFISNIQSNKLHAIPFHSNLLLGFT